MCRSPFQYFLFYLRLLTSNIAASSSPSSSRARCRSPSYDSVKIYAFWTPLHLVIVAARPPLPSLSCFHTPLFRLIRRMLVYKLPRLASSKGGNRTPFYLFLSVPSFVLLVSRSLSPSFQDSRFKPSLLPVAVPFRAFSDSRDPGLVPPVFPSLRTHKLSLHQLSSLP